VGVGLADLDQQISAKWLKASVKVRCQEEQMVAKYCCVFLLYAWPILRNINPLIVSRSYLRIQCTLLLRLKKSSALQLLFSLLDK